MFPLHRRGRIDAARYVCKFRSRRTSDRNALSLWVPTYRQAPAQRVTRSEAFDLAAFANGGPSMGRLGPLRPAAADGQGQANRLAASLVKVPNR